MYALEKDRTPAMLDKNENPFSLPPSSREELRELVSRIELNRYPDPEYGELREILGEVYGIPPENMVLGNGGDEILWLLVIAFTQPGNTVVYPNPSFSQYFHLRKVFRLEEKTFGFSLQGNRFVPEEERFLEILEREDPKLVLVDSPNNPTGMVFSPDLLIRAATLTKAPFLVDEAYVDFHGPSMLDLWKKGALPKNMLLLRTLSKAWGMAGLRLGFAVGDKEMVDTLNGIRSPFNVNIFTQQAATLLIRHQEWVEGRILTLQYTRDAFIREANRLSRWQAFESSGNFVLLKTDLPEELFQDAFSEARVRVRSLNTPWEGTWIRITVGTEEDMQRVLESMKSLE
jgi:histidinol-phosphate aminotransferase